MKGIIKTGAVASAVAATINYLAYTPSTGRSVQAATPTNAGATPYIVRRIMAYYGGVTGIIYLTFGTGVVGAAGITAVLPRFDVPRLMNVSFGEGSFQPIPAVVMTAPLVVQSTAGAAAPLDVSILVEVIELPDWSV